MFVMLWLVALAAQTPSELSALLEKAHLGEPTAWCRADEKLPGAFAAAIGGRYIVLTRDGAVTALARYGDNPDLACYTAEKARQLSGTIAASETIEGEITPRWSTTVVCGFTDATTAVCWQYSPAQRTFVKVGGWTT